MEMDDNATLAVVVARLDDMKNAQAGYEERTMGELQGIRDEIRRFHEDKVSRGEWIQRNTHSDSRFEQLGRDLNKVKTDTMAAVAEVKQDAAARRTPWTSVLASSTGVGALVVSLVVAVYSMSGG